MPIVVNLDVMMAKRKMSLNELSAKVGVTLANLVNLKNNPAKAVRCTTRWAICRALDCQPVDLLEYVPEQEETEFRERPWAALFLPRWLTSVNRSGMVGLQE